MKPPGQPWSDKQKKGSREGARKRERAAVTFRVRAASGQHHQTNGENVSLLLSLPASWLAFYLFSCDAHDAQMRGEAARPAAENRKREREQRAFSFSLFFFFRRSPPLLQSCSPTIRRKARPRFFFLLPSQPRPFSTPPQLHTQLPPRSPSVPRSSSTSPPPGAAPAA